MLPEITCVAKEESIPRGACRPNWSGARWSQGPIARGHPAAIFGTRRRNSAGGAGAYKRLESQVSVFLMPRGECSQIASARGPRRALALIRHHYMSLPLSVNFALHKRIRSEQVSHSNGKTSRFGWFSWLCELFDGLHCGLDLTGPASRRQGTRSSTRRRRYLGPRPAGRPCPRNPADSRDSAPH